MPVDGAAEVVLGDERPAGDGADGKPAEGHDGLVAPALDAAAGANGAAASPPVEPMVKRSHASGAGEAV